MASYTKIRIIITLTTESSPPCSRVAALEINNTASLSRLQDGFYALSQIQIDLAQALQLHNPFALHIDIKGFPGQKNQQPFQLLAKTTDLNTLHVQLIQNGEPYNQEDIPLDSSKLHSLGRILDDIAHTYQLY